MIGGRNRKQNDEALLSAYLDGELDVRERLEVELWLAEDSKARRLLERLHSADRLVRSALSSVLDEPPPAALLRRIEAVAAGRRRALQRAAAGRSRLVWTLAACSLLLLAALPAVWFWSAEHSRQAEMTAREAEAAERTALEASLQQALQEALERTLSGQSLPWRAEGASAAGEILPVRTYKSRSGQWCREYRIEALLGGEPVQERGIACRVEPGDGTPARWERKVLFLDDGGLPAAPGSPT